MGLAPFFDKTALAAAAVLQGFDRERFAEALDAQTVAIAFDDAGARTIEGRTTLTLAVNLAARLYPTLVLLTHGDDAAQFKLELAALAYAINPNILLADAPVAASTSDSAHRLTDPSGGGSRKNVVLVIGDTSAIEFRLNGEFCSIYVGSNKWDARVSTSQPVGSGSSEIPFGAAAAACLGAANVFRHVFQAELRNPALDHSLTFSTLSLLTMAGVEMNSVDVLDEDAPATLDCVNLGETVLVGAGAIGQAVLWSLARTRGLGGTLHVIDDEVVDDTNAQRYILTASSDIDVRKTAIAEALMFPDPNSESERIRCETSDHESLGRIPSCAGLAVRQVPITNRAALKIVPHHQRWGAFLAQRVKPWRLSRVLVAVDSARDRIAVQAALPRWIGNAWTQPGDLGLSIHSRFGESSCLACFYIPDNARVKNEDVLVAESVGLSNDIMLVRQLLATNAPVDVAVIEQIARGLGVSLEPLLPFVGRPLRSFYSEAVCGGIVLRLQSHRLETQSIEILTENGGKRVQSPSTGSEQPGQLRDRAATVPMAFQSALAGVLLAAATVANAAGLTGIPPGMKAALDILRPLPSRLLVPVARHGSGKCLCHDGDYIAAFRQQWGNSNTPLVSDCAPQSAALPQAG